VQAEIDEMKFDETCNVSNKSDGIVIGLMEGEINEENADEMQDNLESCSITADNVSNLKESMHEPFFGNLETNKKRTDRQTVFVPSRKDTASIFSCESGLDAPIHYTTDQGDQLMRLLIEKKFATEKEVNMDKQCGCDCTCC